MPIFERFVVRGGLTAPSFVKRVQTAVTEAWRSYTLGPLTSNSPELAKLYGGPTTSTGMAVSEVSAMNQAAVHAAVTVISSAVGSMPLVTFKYLGNGGKDRDRSFRLYSVLHDRPNPEMTAYTMRSVMTAHALTWGNAYAEIERDQMGRAIALWPITPDRMTPVRRADGELVYRAVNHRGGEQFLNAADVIHIKGLGFDGLMGYSVIQHARESIGLGMAAEKFGGAFFGNGATFGGVISYKGAKPADEVRKNTNDALNAQHQGVDRAHKILALYNDATFTRIGIPPNDAQFLETRKFQVTEIARWFNLPPHKLGDLERATFSNIEQQEINFVQQTLLPWLQAWEQELDAKLLSPGEQQQYTFEHVVEGLLRGDATARATFYKTMSEIGAISVNEIRAREGLPPIPGGDLPRLGNAGASK